MTPAQALRPARAWKVAVAACVIAAAFLSAALFVPFRGFQNDVFVDIPRGTGARGIAAALTGAGVVRYSWQFLLVRAIHPSAKLQAGEYRFSREASARDVFDRIARGDIYYFEFTVPEGANMFDIAHELEAEKVLPAGDFLRAAADPSPIADLAPGAKTLEGYLFPSTYRLTNNVTAEQLVLQMTGEFRKQWKKRSDKAAAAPPGGAQPSSNIQRAVTLASLVEKETGVAAERPLVASVFTNRLAKNMRLECDPTVIYAALLENRYRGSIHKSDLASANPYNTYQNAGLPPGPIANPGAASLAAALAPAETEYLFFVAAPGGGSHRFSETMAQHEKAVAEYRHAARGAAVRKNAEGQKR